MCNMCKCLCVFVPTHSKGFGMLFLCSCLCFHILCIIVAYCLGVGCPGDTVCLYACCVMHVYPSCSVSFLPGVCRETIVQTFCCTKGMGGQAAKEGGRW